jgi:Cyclin M transmembrane N-terminal domain
MGGDLLALLAAVVLLAANAFFVGAEFALISSRRDRLEAMAEEGSAGARTALRAGADLSRMLAASQLGITICSLLLGRLGEPAVAHLLERPLQWVGMPEAVLEPLSFAVSLAIVVVAHILLGEMVPKNIAIAGPERTATWLVPPFLVFTTVARPLIELFNLLANGVLRLIGVEPRDELETSFTPNELADLIAESGREGLLDQDESQRLTRTISSVGSTVAEVVVPPPSRAPGSPGSPCSPPTAASPATCTSRTSSTCSNRTTSRARCPRNGSAGCPRSPWTCASTRPSPSCAAPGPTWAGWSTRAPRPSGWSPWRTWSSTTSARSATPPTPARTRSCAALDLKCG